MGVKISLNLVPVLTVLLRARRTNNQQPSQSEQHSSLFPTLSTFLQRFSLQRFTSSCLQLPVLAVITPEGFAQEMCLIQQSTNKLAVLRVSDTHRHALVRLCLDLHNSMHAQCTYIVIIICMNMIIILLFCYHYNC